MPDSTANPIRDEMVRQSLRERDKATVYPHLRLVEAARELLREMDAGGEVWRESPEVVALREALDAIGRPARPS